MEQTVIFLDNLVNYKHDKLAKSYSCGRQYNSHPRLVQLEELAQLTPHNITCSHM
jgi:hypothetical protein